MTVYNLDRATREAENIDALGKKWVIKIKRESGLCYARPEPDREDAQIPKAMGGLWTKPALLMEQIQKYVVTTWDNAEQKAQENERKAQAAKENKAKAKKDEAKD